jgi:hypothetical protein
MVHPNWQATELLEAYKLHTHQQAFVEPNYVWVGFCRGMGIPGGYTDRGTTDTDKDTDFCIRHHTRTPIRHTHTHHGGYVTRKSGVFFNIIFLFILYIFVYLFTVTSNNNNNNISSQCHTIVTPLPTHRNDNSDRQVRHYPSRDTNTSLREDE